MPSKFLSFICFIRRTITSPLIWMLIKPFLKKPGADYWSKVKDQPLSVFNAIMSAVEYKLDPMWGILDYTYDDPSYYFYQGNWDNILLGVDCDDTALLWILYLKDKPYIEEVYMILGMNGYNIKQSHFFTVAKFDDGKYRLFNYNLYHKCFNSVQEACDEFRTHELLESGKYTKLKWAVYLEHKKKDAI